MEKRTIKLLFAFSVIALVAAGCGKSRQANDQQQTAQTLNQQEASSSPVGQTQVRQNAGKPDYKPGYVIVTQKVEGSNLNEPYNQIQEGTTAYDLLNSTHTVVSKSYSGLGQMVFSIDGRAADSKHFWSFYVNGKSSTVGASSYKVKDGDAIDWKLEEIK